MENIILWKNTLFWSRGGGVDLEYLVTINTYRIGVCDTKKAYVPNDMCTIKSNATPI